MVYVGVERSHKKIEEVIEMGGLVARRVLGSSAVPRRNSNKAVALASDGQTNRLLSVQASEQSVATDTRSKLRWANPPSMAAETKAYVDSLNRTLEILWRPTWVQFKPNIGWERDTDKTIGQLTVDCDETSARVPRRMVPGDSMLVLDIRERQNPSGSIIRVRTQHGWFTWGRLSDINAGSDADRLAGDPSSLRNKRDKVKYHNYFQFHISEDPEKRDHVLRWADGDCGHAPLSMRWMHEDKVPAESVHGHEDKVWIDMAEVFEEKRSTQEGNSSQDLTLQEASVKIWSLYPSAQKAHWSHMALQNKAWSKQDGVDVNRAKSVIRAAQRDLKSLPFFKNVPDAYLSRLAQTTMQSLQRFQTGDTIVEFAGEQSFTSASLVADAARPVHHISVEVLLDVPELGPESIRAATVRTWAILTNMLRRHGLRGFAGAAESLRELNKLKDELEENEKLALVEEWKVVDELISSHQREPQPEPQPESQAEPCLADFNRCIASILKWNEEVIVVSQCVDAFLKLLQAHVKGMQPKVDECKAYMVDPFCELFGPDRPRKWKLAATVLIDVQTGPMNAKHRSNRLGAVRRLFNATQGGWINSKPAVQLWWSWLVEGAPGSIALEDTWDDFERQLGKLVGGRAKISPATLNALTVADLDGALQRAGLTPAQLEYARARIPGLQESLAAAEAAEAEVAEANEPNLFDKWLERLGLPAASLCLRRRAPSPRHRSSRPTSLRFPSDRQTDPLHSPRTLL
eukprot:COSAG06_NODE_2106_length_7572_cov_7.446675_3_plen_745_part_00